MGYQSNVGDGSMAHVFGNGNTVGANVQNATVAGDHVGVSDNCTEVVAIGYASALTTTGQSKIVNIGSTNIVQGNLPNGTVTTKITVVGALNTVGQTDANSSLVTVAGTDNTTGSSAIGLLVLGSVNSVGIGALTSELVGFANQITDNCQKISVFGQSNTVTAPAGFPASDLVVVGDSNALTCLLAAGFASLTNTIAVGFGNTVTNMATTTVIGQNNTITTAFGASEFIAVGSGNSTVDAGGSVILGHRNVLPAGSGSVLILGSGINQGAGTCGLGAILIGNGAGTTSNSADSIAIGTNSQSSDNSCVIGHSDPTVVTEAMHSFIVRGLDVSIPASFVAIDTINVIDNPAAGSTGLTIVYNAGGTYSNKTVKASVSPIPVGSLYLYIDP